MGRVIDFNVGLVGLAMEIAGRPLVPLFTYDRKNRVYKTVLALKLRCGAAP
jgi:hypothetical protein